MKITKEQLEQIIREEINEIRIKIPLPRWTSKFMKGAPEEEPPADDGPGILDKVKQALSTDITPDSWKHDPYRERPERPLTAAEKSERAEKEKRDLRSQEIGKQKKAEREERKARKRAEMGITKEELEQIIKEEIQELSETTNSIVDLRAKMGLSPEAPISDEEKQAALTGEERPITWDIVEELMERIDRLELKVYKGID
tara:strand:- start:926 stop:1525 length:600 start_codon:yes stop_codon:yes gene_type:complete